MEIVIVGAGIAGCTTYLELRKHLPKPQSGDDHSITIYEAYDTGINTTPEDRGDDGPTHSSTLVVGGGLGVAGNGLNVIKRLDMELLRDIVRGGYSAGIMNMKSRNGTVLVRMLPAGKPSTGGEGQKSMNLVGCSRHSLWRSIRMKVPQEAIVRKRVSEVVAKQDGRNVIYFADGSAPVEADLVIGADGLKSSAKRAIFQEKQDPYPPQYEGLCGIGGFVPYSLVKDHVEVGSMNFVMGGNGFFGYFISDSAPDAPFRDSPYHISAPGQSVAWWSTYTVDECPDPKTLDKEAVTKQLRERHRHWRDPLIQQVLKTIEVKNMYPTWIVPPLPTWERDGVVLVGDAAHALPPTSGQGCSQALEDAECLSMFLGHYLKKASDGKEMDPVSQKGVIRQAAKQYMSVRQPRVTMILKEAQGRQNMKRDKSLVEEYILYAFMWIMGWFPGVMAKPMIDMLEYNVAVETQKVIDQQK